jgi:cellulose synthase/poly-beta-1,6-N-acetylglucosamine synthase-like glycosyltransferase
MGDLPGTSMDVSVVISTYNRCSLLARALESLQHQETSGVSYEILVVDNNSTDETRAVAQRFMDSTPGRLRYIFEPKQGLSMRAMRALPVRAPKLLPSPTTMYGSPATGYHASKQASRQSPAWTS